MRACARRSFIGSHEMRSFAVCSRAALPLVGVAMAVALACLSGLLSWEAAWADSAGEQPAAAEQLIAAEGLVAPNSQGEGPGLAGRESVPMAQPDEQPPSTQSTFAADLDSPERGTVESPLRISTEEDLFAFAAAVNGGNALEGKFVALEADVELSGERAWEPIGKRTALGDTTVFSGSFDGCGHAVTNFRVNDAESAYVGFFGYVNATKASPASIKNFKLMGAHAQGSDIDVQGALDSAATKTGGLIGRVGTTGQVFISNCVVDVNVAGLRSAGGFVGEGNSRLSIANCASYGCVVGAAAAGEKGEYPSGYLGGFVGSWETIADASLANCLFGGQVVPDESMNAAELVQFHGSANALIGRAGPTYQSSVPQALLQDDCYVVQKNATVKAARAGTGEGVVQVEGTVLEALSAATAPLAASLVNGGQEGQVWQLEGDALPVPAPFGSWVDYPLRTHSISFVRGGGTWAVDFAAYVPVKYAEGGEAVELPDASWIVRDGYSFKGWYLSPDFSGAALTTVPADAASDLTFYAKWERVYEDPVTVTFDVAGGAWPGAAQQPVTLERGESVLRPADPERDGYDFTGWQLGGQPYDFSRPVSESIVLVAAWDEVLPTEILISTRAELEALRDAVNDGTFDYGATVKLQNDIDLGGNALNQWTPIGKITSFKSGAPYGALGFSGTFDGQGHTITGLYIDADAGGQALFGFVDVGSTIENLVVKGRVTSKGSCVAGVAAAAALSSSAPTRFVNVGSEVQVTSTATSDYVYAGGVLAYAGYASVSFARCYNKGAVSVSRANSYLGGICGIQGQVSDSYNVGAVTALASNSNTYAGGIVGSVPAGSSISRCYNAAAVTLAGSGSNYGGIAGSGSNIASCFYSDKTDVGYPSYSTAFGASQYASVSALLASLLSLSVGTWQDGSFANADFGSAPALVWEPSGKEEAPGPSGTDSSSASAPSAADDKIKDPGTTPDSAKTPASTTTETSASTTTSDSTKTTTSTTTSDSTKTTTSTKPSGSAKTTASAKAEGFAKSTTSTKARTSLAKAKVSVAKAIYNGKAQKPKVTVKLGSKTLKKGKDYTVAYANNKKASKKAKVSVSGIGSYKGSITKEFTIAKAANTLRASAKAKVVTVKLAKLKKKNQVVAKSKMFKVTKAQGKVAFKKLSGNKKIVVSSAGKLTVKRGLSRGTYKVKVRVRAAGNANYKAATKTVALKIRVK